MQKLMLWVFPLGVLFIGAFYPLALLFYWLANNFWTFGQLALAHRLQDKKLAAEATVVEAAKEQTSFSKPKPGAKPVRDVPGRITPTETPSRDGSSGGAPQRDTKGRTGSAGTSGSANGSPKRAGGVGPSGGISLNGDFLPPPGAAPRPGAKPKKKKR
jgi:YidC/Oxa1 family membrane protein insertase